ncbi:hypothetical protein ASG89_29810 [Paenibacillus sp. Soil766]|uniref:hypothetical protein n=1 Tax=Paenibacillus sp. Soil766 TaxID=1736404 RepID=UPI00070E22A3|nr:hypothetical protein [Paenibacillus sp. Soil766]KRE97059.1 hypothetical protein ASG89_29810 [Paenibacillus sp. Soil766]
MKIHWKKTTIMFILAASLVIPSASFHVAADEKYSQSYTLSRYQLTDSLQVDVKSVLNEPTSEGTKIGAVIRYYNAGERLVGVPEYEVRVKTNEGLEYIMRPSLANARNIQPKETIELSYWNVIDRYDVFALDELSWSDVDEFVYPKEEKRIISLPITDLEWKGDKANLSDPAQIKQWQDTFTIPMLTDQIQYQPVSLNEQNTSNGIKTVVGFLATNMGDKPITVPDFRINGKSGNKVFNGERLEQDELVLDPGEKNYVHYAIPVKSRSELKNLTVLTPEEYVADDKTHITYTIGRLMINLVGATNSTRLPSPSGTYELNKPIQFDPISQLIQSDIEVSMVDLNMSESAGGGFKSVVAKFKMLNKSGDSVPVPSFQTVLTIANGKKFSGTRQDTKVNMLIPNISYVIYYTYIVPNSETGERLTMEILDGKKVEPYNFTIAAFKTKVVDSTDGTLAFYPFHVQLIDTSKTTSFNVGKGANYSYTLGLDFDIKLQDEVVVDQSFSKLRVEVADESNRIMASKVFSFIDEKKLVSGNEIISFDADRLESTLNLRLYEVIDTPFGEVRRLMQTVKR